MSTAVPTTFAPALQERVASLDLSEPQLRLRATVDPAEPYYVVGGLGLEYRRFLLLRLAHPALEIPAPPRIDMFWRMHAADPMAFAADRAVLVEGTGLHPDALRPPERPHDGPASALVRELYDTAFRCGTSELWGWPQLNVPRNGAPGMRPVCQTLPAALEHLDLKSLRAEAHEQRPKATPPHRGEAELTTTTTAPATRSPCTPIPTATSSCSSLCSPARSNRCTATWPWSTRRWRRSSGSARSLPVSRRGHPGRDRSTPVLISGQRIPHHRARRPYGGRGPAGEMSPPSADHPMSREPTLGRPDLTRRRLYTAVWVVTYPLLLAFLTQQILTAVDTALLGRYSTAALSSAALSTQIYLAATMVAFGRAIAARPGGPALRGECRRRGRPGQRRRAAA